jgi:integrase
MALTDAQIRSFKAGPKRFRKSDGGGLFLEVMPSGGKFFRLACRFDDRQRTYFIGEYPSMRLADARLRAAEHKSKIKEGIDPKPAKHELQSKELTRDRRAPIWRDLAKDYLMLRQRGGAAPRTLQKLHRQIQVTIDHFGNRELTSITAEDVLSVVNPIANKGQVENAHEIRSRFSQVFRYAAARGLIKHDPAAITIDAMVPRRRGEFAGLTDQKQIGQLMRDIQAYREKYFWVGSALLLSAYLFPRNTELRGMRWDEIDWQNKVWEIPSERMKMKREHLIPQLTRALHVLASVKDIDVGSDLVFPAPRDPRRMMSDNTFNKALRAMGYSRDQHVHHGFRTTASTLLNEMGWNSDWIERQLAHVPQNKVRSSYNKAQYLEARTEMMSAYAEKLDELSLTEVNNANTSAE